MIDKFRKSAELFALALCLGALIPTLWLAYHVPIYTDEMTFQILHARYFVDHGMSLSLLPQCSQSAVRPWPFLFLPIRFVQSLIYGDISHPIILRIMGIIDFAAWVALAWGFVYKLGGSDKTLSRSQALMLLLAPITLGVLPFMMVINRPEQTLLLGITLLSLLTVSPPEWLKKRSWLNFFIIPTTALVMMADHPRTLFFLPWLLGCVWFACKDRFQRVVTSAFVIIITYQSYSFYIKGLGCPLDDGVRKIFSQMTLSLSAQMLLSHPRAFMAMGFKNLFTLDYVRNASFISTYMSFWLPLAPAPGPKLMFLNSWIIAMFGVIFAFSACSLIFFIIRVIFQKIRGTEVRANAILFLILIGVLGLMFTETVKNSYQSALVLPLWLLIFSGSVACWRSKRARNLVTLFLVSSIPLSYLSQAALYKRYREPARSTWSSGGDVQGQVYSISGINYDTEKAKMLEAFQSCHLEPGHLQHLLVDDLTYTVLWTSSVPFHAVYLTGDWGKDIKDLRSFLLRHGSDGVAVRCRYLDNDRDRSLLAIAERHGEYCCIPRNRLEASPGTSR